MIGDILEKWAQGIPLDSLEIDELKQWGNFCKNMSDFVLGLQNGQSSIDIDTINAILGTIGGWNIGTTTLSSSDGGVILDGGNKKITAGAGAVTMDANGISIADGLSTVNKIKWVSSGNTISALYTDDNGTTVDTSQDVTYAGATTKARYAVNVNANNDTADISLGTYDNSFSSYMILYMQGKLKLLTFQSNGSIYYQFSHITTSQTVFNEQGVDIDFRVESDTNANMFVLDAGLDAIGVGGVPTSGDGLTVNSVKADKDTNIFGTAATAVVNVDAGNNTLTVGGGTPIGIISETTFTPRIDGTGAAGTGTYSVQGGKYFKIGKMVTVLINMVWSAHTGTGNMIIEGLPFTAENNGINVACAVSWSNITLAAVGNKIIAVVSPNTTSIILQEVGSGTAAALNIDTAGTLRVQVTYLTNS